MQVVPQNRPEEYDLVCPITLRVFRDPVTAADGHTYERQAIERWIKEHGTSPLTRQPLSVDDLLPACHVKDTVGRRPSLTASFDSHDESIACRSPRVTPANGKVIRTTGERCHVLREGWCCRRRCCILTICLSAMVLLACGFTVGLFLEKFSAYITSKYSSELTTSSPTYCRFTCGKGNFYYKATTVRVVQSGKYHFSSKSNIDTYGYIYINSFDPTNPHQNLLTENNDGGERKQFKLKVHLKSGTTYILVTTTNSPNVTGSFSIITSGSTSVSFPPTTTLWTTTPKTTRQTTTTSSIQSTYRSSLNTSNPKYCRPSKKCLVPDFYYQAIQVNVSMNGSYSIVSNSSIDTHVYIYNNSFNVSNPNQNLLRKDDDRNHSIEEKQFKLKVFLHSGQKYILVVTTKKPRKTGVFLVTAIGSGSITFV